MNRDHTAICGRVLIIAISLFLAMGIFMSWLLLDTVSAKSGSDATSRHTFSTLTAKWTDNQILENPRSGAWQAKVTAAVTGTATIKGPLLTELTLAVTG